MGRMKDAAHLFRFAALFVIAFLAFWAIRGFVVPKSFGKYGHYRAAAIDEIAARPMHYAGHDACESCHTDVLDAKKGGKHAHVNCEACHGPLSQHAADPSITPAKIDTATLCVRCHAASAARPKTFPQVIAEEHSNGVPCETCHQPHSPGMEASAAGGAK
jgi:ABC-type nickel/cobalt efflux system permease component RcnA